MIRNRKKLLLVLILGVFLTTQVVSAKWDGSVECGKGGRNSSCPGHDPIIKVPIRNP
jgi:hypothetical protein